MSKTKKSADIVENKNVVQAVLVADSFNNNFYPLCNESPVVSRKHMMQCLKLKVTYLF